MERKTDNICEIQDACDGRSKVMILLKLVKGSFDNELLENEYPGSLNRKRVTKQLVTPWMNSGRVVCADSNFSSLTCAIYMHDIGLKFIGVVKTATK